jgi:hypothetical protein
MDFLSNLFRALISMAYNYNMLFFAKIKLIYYRLVCNLIILIISLFELVVPLSHFPTLEDLTSHLKNEQKIIFVTVEGYNLTIF